MKTESPLPHSSFLAPCCPPPTQWQSLSLILLGAAVLMGTGNQPPALPIPFKGKQGRGLADLQEGPAFPGENLQLLKVQRPLGDIKGHKMLQAAETPRIGGFLLHFQGLY